MLKKIFWCVKMAVNIGLITVILPLLCFGQEAFMPPDGKAFVFIGQDNATIETYIKEVSHVPHGFMLYTSIQNIEGLFAPSEDFGAGVFYADALMEKYPQARLQLGLYMVGALKEVYQGAYDHNIDKMAAWMKTKQVPIYLRVGYEFDGPHNHYDPGDYVKAYRYLVDRLRLAGVDNVAYVWHSYAYKREEPFTSWYPGDDYVDWVGISCFRLPNFHIDPIIAFARKHHKPVMIAEGTPQGTGVHRGKLSWAAWYHLVFRLMAQHDIKAISYINSQWETQPMWAGQGWGDARIEANEYIKGKWLDEIKKDKYQIMGLPHFR